MWQASSGVVSSDFSSMSSALSDSITGEVSGLGGYGEYTIADQNISFKLPKGITREQASTVPLAATTAWLALFSKDYLNLDRSNASGTSVLVWGGSCKSNHPYGLHSSRITAMLNSIGR